MVATNLHTCDLTTLASTPHVWFQAHLSPASVFSAAKSSSLSLARWSKPNIKSWQAVASKPLYRLILSDFGTDYGKLKSASELKEMWQRAFSTSDSKCKYEQVGGLERHQKPD